MTIHCIKEYIDAHIYEDISLRHLSEMASYNNSYLSRMFSQKTGETLSAYIAKRKMEVIKELMRETRMTMNEIMLEAGFETRSYFNRFIKRQTGMTPQKFRESLRKHCKANYEENPSIR